MKKLVVSLLIMVVGIGTFGFSVSASEKGGWDENEGYYTISDEIESNEFVVMPYSGPYHDGRKERSDSGSTTRFRAVGWTTWSGVYHYTTAQMEDYWSGRILTTSGRQWGWNGTEAISPWWTFDPNINDSARTYYGN